MNYRNKQLNDTANEHFSCSANSSERLSTLSSLLNTASTAYNFVSAEKMQHFEVLVCKSVFAWGHDLSTNAEQGFNRRPGWQNCICFLQSRAAVLNLFRHADHVTNFALVRGPPTN